MHNLLSLAALLAGQVVGQPVAQAIPETARWAQFSVLTPAGPSEPRREAFQTLSILVHSRHKIAKTDTPRTLTETFFTDLKSLQSTNRNEFVVLRSGAYIRVHNKRGLLYEVTVKGETLDAIVRRFKSAPAEHKALKESVVRANRLPAYALLSPYSFDKGERIILPGVYISFDGYNSPFPGQGIRISSGFGYRYHPVQHKRAHHNGWDIPKPYGTKVFPSRSGEVTYAGWAEGYGYMVEVRHKDGMETRYGHLSKISVSVGQNVEKGKTQIGNVGTTGWTTGPHLHFEIRDSRGRPVNPAYKIGRR